MAGAPDLAGYQNSRGNMTPSYKHHFEGEIPRFIVEKAVLLEPGKKTSLRKTKKYNSLKPETNQAEGWCPSSASFAADRFRVLQSPVPR